MLAGRARLPAQQARSRPARSRRSPSGAKTPRLLIQPPRLVEIATSGDGGDESARRPRDAARGRRSDAAERLLGRGPAAARPPSSVGHRHRRSAAAAGGPARSARRAAAGADAPGGRVRVEAGPTRRARSGRAPARSASIWSPVRQRGVVQRVAGDRQAPALDRVGEDDARPVGLRVAARRSASSSSPRSWPPRSADQAGQVVVGVVARARAPATPRSPRRRRNRSRSAAGRRPARTGSGTPRSPCRRCAGAARSPPGRANAACSCGPYFASTTCQPASREELRRARSTRMPGTTRSRLWRLRSTIHSDVAEAAGAPGRRSPPRRCPRPARRRRPGR